MNLHVVPDSPFSNKFYSNLVELSLSDNNRVIVRSNQTNLKYIRQNLPIAPLYSSQFSALVGDTRQYEKVFIHQLSPLMYRWIARHEFRELNWMVWGTDVYNLPDLDYNFYEDITREWVRQDFSLETWLFKAKVLLTNSYFKNQAYAKIDNALTWMVSEYDFIKSNIPSFKGAHQFFFYENEVPYNTLDDLIKTGSKRSEIPVYIIGNSGTPTNNHLDAVKVVVESGIKADLVIPVSYGDKKYIQFLKRNLAHYQYGKIEFIDRYMPFEEYLNFLYRVDGLIMNTIRPQGYGNIFIMLYLGKPVFLNKKNISLRDIEDNGIVCSKLTAEDLNRLHQKCDKNVISQFLSHEKLGGIYSKLFS
ncbi:MAG: TDP-N-acetylfucosamine:lipid II N-acetylfucosaminyltransferase [Cyclobacteriaceae bacterium]|nr:TDP-N-acetylfucosamine:lipid II N-acetylfucosaminyltransferase [Cyclobacteriaceae bacterium]